MFTRSSSVEPKTLDSRTTRPSVANGTQRSISTPSSGEKSVIGNDLKIIGEGLKIISRGILQVDGEIEGDVQAAEVIIGKQRHGPTGTVEVQFEGQFTRFSDLAQDSHLPERI